MNTKIKTMSTKREIQFRVWDTKYLEFSNFTNRDPHFDVSNGKLFFWEKTRNEDGSYGGDIILEDLGDRFILQQYTGLKDSKGNEVWEGDIIKYTRLIEKERRIVELFSFIKFQDAKFGFDLTGFNDMFYDLSDEPDFEVVGNIFEHSELLKDEN